MSRIHEVLDLSYDVEELRSLLDSGVDPDERNAAGETVLAFRATDRSGLRSNIVEKTIVVE